MTNLAGMIFDGRASGTGMEMKKLFSKSAQLGDSKAINAMRVIDDLVAHVDNPTPKILRDALGDFQPPWLIDIVPMKTWLKVLTDHGWMLTNVRTKPSGELAPFASAVTTDGSPFGLHISAGMHVSGHKPDKTTDLYRKKYGDADGLIVYNKVMAMATGKNPAITHLCIGRLHKDGVWSDYFLQAGGLEAALRQRLELSKNPFLDPSYKFRNENAVSIAAKIEADTLRKINRL
jgi:hypothetical protein